MRYYQVALLAMIVVLLSAATETVQAAKWRFLHYHRSHFHTPGAEATDNDLYAPATAEQLHHAGHPQHIAPWAKPSNTCDYTGYNVGGGSAALCRSRGRTVEEGTWGWDYVGRKLPRRVGLNWWGKPKEQGGTGSYEPDGPKLIELEHSTGE